MHLAKLFLDSSALFAGIASADGAARVLLLLGEAGQIEVWISEQVVAETERALARKAPRALPAFRQALHGSGVLIVADPGAEEVAAAGDWISHAADVPILVAARKVKADFVVTLNRKHFLDDPVVATRSGLRLCTPGEALEWVRGRLGTEVRGR
jgi:predicted nucleic acid-binding protein